MKIAYILLQAGLLFMILLYVLGALIFFLGVYIAVRLAMSKTNAILRVMAIKQGAPLGQFMTAAELHEYIELNKDQLGLKGPADNTNPEYTRIREQLIKYGK